MTEPPADQVYFKECAWNYLRFAYDYKQQGRLARAQEALRESRFYEAKIYPEFIDRELSENIDKISKLITRGY